VFANERTPVRFRTVSQYPQRSGAVINTSLNARRAHAVDGNYMWVQQAAPAK
jgi:hypothetical protein